MQEFINWIYSISKGPVSYGANIVTILGLLFIFLQLRNSKIREKRARAFQLIDRYWLQIYPIYLKLCKETPPLSIRHIAENNEYIVLMAYFDELGYLWVHDIIDKEIIRSRLYTEIIVNFNLMLGYITEFRECTNNPSHSLDWEKMTDELKNHRTKFNLADPLSND